MEVARGWGWGGGVRKPTSNHKELYCRDKSSKHFKFILRTRQVFLYKKENQLGMKIRFVHYDCLRL